MPTTLEALTLALDHQRAGRLPEAECIYRNILSVDPRNADALHLLSTIACGAGRLDEARSLVQEAIRSRPDVPQFHSTLGNVLCSLGRAGEARIAYQRALRLNPQCVEARVNLGNTLQQLDLPAEAAVQYREALPQSPGTPEIHNNLGNALTSLGLLEDAIASFRKALALNPSYAEAHANLAAALLLTGAYQEAESHCLEALRLQPETAEAHHNLADALYRQRDFTGAVPHYRDAIRLYEGLTPSHRALASAYCNLGAALSESGHRDESESCCRRAISLQPDLAQAHTNLAQLRLGEDRFEEAEACCREALRHQPDAAGAYRTLGNVYFAQGRLEDCDAAYREALKLQPEDAGTRWNVGVLRLLQGQFEEGWREYEWRWKRPGTTPREFSQPRWDGSPLAGRRILIYAEQGLGDTVQFLRYLPMVQQAGGQLVFESQPQLVELLRGCPDVGHVIGCGEQLPQFDVQAPLLSLPHIFGTTLRNIPAQNPYLFIDPARVEAMRERLPAAKGYRVGLAWSGNPRHPDDRKRSISPAVLAPLTGIPGVSLISLHRDADLSNTGLPIHYTGKGSTIADASAMIMNLDLVISVDSLIAHLAGALGRSVWTLVPFAADFRWLLDREDSPWYPTMRLFRQPTARDWRSVIDAVCEALRDATRH